MIKSWKKFNESIYFEGSPEFLNVRNKYALSKNDIKDFLQDLEDERDISCSSFQSRVSKFDDKQIVIKTWINFSKSYKNPKLLLNDYQSFLKQQMDDINQILTTCERIAKVEKLEIIQKKVEYIPFWGAGNNQKELDDIRVVIAFKRVVETDEMVQSHKEFTKRDNPEKKLTKLL